ncbi:MAG: glycosyltransferase family 4 protein [Vicinamibacterales bacterium]
MRIGLDARYLSHGLTGGVHTYVLNLATMLPIVAPDDQFVFYADRKAPFEIDPLPPSVTLRLLPWRSPASSVRNDRQLGRLMDEDDVDVAHHPANYAFRGQRPTVVTLHDTLNLFPVARQIAGMARTPGRLGRTLYLAAATSRTIRRADRIIAPSEHARQDAAARTGVPLSRIDAVHSAAAASFAPVTDGERLNAVRARYRLPPRMILGDAIKNPRALVEAFRSLPPNLREGTAIVFFSREPAPRAELAPLLAQDVRFTAQPSTSDLAALYSLAELFVLPSWYEGFGLPLLEAMQCGAPVAGSTRGSIPEIVGDAGLLFDVDDRAALTRHLSAVLGHADVRRDLAARGLARAATFSWERTARQTLDAYRRAAGGS